MEIIALFNHKGGVSKTTTTFNLGWMLAQHGHKTLIVDADPQCNLTALVLGYDQIDDIEIFYSDNPECDIHTGIKPVLDGSLEKISSATPITTGNKKLSLLCGNIKLSEAETQISVALTTSTAIPAIRNIPGSVGSFLRMTASKYKFDYVLIDMSPSVGALNECLLMASDYFIVPTSPDFFCAQAIKSLSDVVPRWNDEVSKFRSNDLIYKFPLTPPKFLGFISQKYRPRGGAPAKSFQKWIDIINKEVTDSLIPSLNPIGMTIKSKLFEEVIEDGEPFNLANISDFNSLIAQSQKHSIPVFALNDDQIEQGGYILDNMKESRDRFHETFSELAESIDKIIKLDREQSKTN